MAKYLAARDIKFGTIDGIRLIAAGSELDENQIKDLPPGSFRTIDENTFPDGRCPTCGSMIATSAGQPGNIPSEGVNRDDAPSAMTAAPQGKDAVAAAVDSKRQRPDNADSGMPSWGKIPIDVERAFVAGQSQMPRPTSAPAAGQQPAQPVDPRALANNKDAQRQSAKAAPKPTDQNMTGGFGNSTEGGNEGAGAAGTVNPPSPTGATGGNPTPPQQTTGNKGGASKP
jgi:hypothetical protein